nr:MULTISPECIES: bacteriocin immunity protein [unclassified Lactococcus]
MEKWDKTELLNELYNLILSKHIRTFERQCLLETKKN